MNTAKQRPDSKNYFGKRPVVLALVYFQCPMLCTMVLNDLLRTLRSMPESVGKDFDIITVSFDPRDTPQLHWRRSKRKTYLAQYNRPGAEAGWHFLTGEQASINALTQCRRFSLCLGPCEQSFRACQRDNCSDARGENLPLFLRHRLCAAGSPSSHHRSLRRTRRRIDRRNPALLLSLRSRDRQIRPWQSADVLKTRRRPATILVLVSFIGRVRPSCSSALPRMGASNLRATHPGRQ